MSEEVLKSPFQGMGYVVIMQSTGIDARYLFEDRMSGKIYKNLTEKALFTMAIAYGIVEQSLDEALDYMIQNGHNWADFGVNGTFIYSEKKRL